MTNPPARTDRRGLPASACSAVAVVSAGVVCAASAGPVRQIAGLSLIGAFAFAVWFMHRTRFDAIVPAIGLTLAFLILAGLALAAVHALSTVPVALVFGLATLAAAWIGASRPTAGPTPRRGRLTPPYPLALAGVLVFAAATIVAVRYSATSATADADGTSSVAIWAYPTGDQLHVGVRQPAGHGGTTLRIVVSQAGATLATWNDVRLAAGQTWQAPALTVTGIGPAQVVALRGGTVVAGLAHQ